MEWEDRDLDIGYGTSSTQALVRRILITKDEVKVAARNIMPYILFSVYLILYTVVAVNAIPDKNVFEQHNAIRSSISDKVVMNRISSTLITLHNISSLDDFWIWLSDALIDCAYPVQNASSSVNTCSKSFRVLGAIRLRQSRVRADSCPVSSLIVPRPNADAGPYPLDARDIAAQGLYATQLSLQAYVLQCDPAAAAAPLPSMVALGISGDPRCGRVLPQLLPWSDKPLGQVGRVSGCYAGVEQVPLPPPRPALLVVRR
jgi:hypothetical protein